MPGEGGEGGKSQIMESLWDYFKEFDFILSNWNPFEDCKQESGSEMGGQCVMVNNLTYAPIIRDKPS